MKILPEDDADNQYDIFKQDYSTLEVTEENSQPQEQEPKLKHTSGRRKRFISNALIGLLLISALLTGILALIRSSDKAENNVIINTQSLDNGTLNQLTSDAGPDAKQQLTISPETLFKQNVLVQGSSDIDKDLNVGGNLGVRGNISMQGSVRIDQDTAILRNLSVNGGGTFGGNLSVSGSITAASLSVGSITISTINVSSDIAFAGHLIPNGPTPSAQPSVSASGGNVTITGNDTAGTIIITIGNGSLIAGEMAIITFKKPFTTTPKVQLTPINATASAIRYYATRSATFFTIDTTTIPSNGATYVFDYLVTQ